MPNLILSSTYGYKWDDIKNWANSVSSCGFSGYVCVILYHKNTDDDTEVKKNLESLGITVLPMDLRGSIFTYRFLSYYYVIESLIRKSAIDNVVMTDIRDVVFQRNPFEWLKKNNNPKIYASSENIRYKDEPWGINNIKESFDAFGERCHNNIIYNAGVISGTGEMIKDLCANIVAISSIANQPTGGGGPDQAAYNILLDMDVYKNVTMFGDHDDGYAAQMGTNGAPSIFAHIEPYRINKEKPRLVDGVVVNSKGEPYCIVHQYDRIPEWKLHY